MDSETLAAVEAISGNCKVKSIFDPPDVPSTSTRPVLPPSPLRFGPPSEESSDEECRNFILKAEPFVPKRATSNTPIVKLRKAPRLRNAPKCTHQFRRGPRKGEICAAFCKIGEEFCGKHKPAVKETAKSNFDFETVAMEQRFHRLKVSKKYKLLQTKEKRAIFENGGRILKVRLPGYLKPIPKTGSYLIFGKKVKGQPARAFWESV